MSKTLTRLTLALLAASLCAPATSAQAPHTSNAQVPPAQTPSTAPPEWVAVSPAEEGFTARMPKQPVSIEQRVQGYGPNASGLRYAAAADDVTTFIVWSMKGSYAGGTLGGGDRARRFAYDVAPYLDGVAELAWELLVTPEFERLEREPDGLKRAAAIGLGMTYRRGFDLSGLPAREYSVTLEKERGHVYVCSEGALVYVVAALGESAGDARLRQFVDSFALKSAVPATSVVGDDAAARGTGVVEQSGNTGGGDVRPRATPRVVKRAVITLKPEPGFTEGARKFNVEGVVRLRAILSSNGQVTNVGVIKGLPHGLTELSVAAAQKIKFEPAQMDGKAVSQYILLEYNFNIY